MNNNTDLYKDLSGVFYRNNTNNSIAPFLIQLTRIGCNFHKDNFHIDHNKKEYKYFAVHYILEGTVYFQTKNNDYILKKGDIFILLAHETYTYYKYDSAEIGLLWVEFDCSGCEDLFLWFKSKGIYVLRENNKIVADKIAQLLEYVKNNNKISQFQLSDLSYSIVMNLYESISIQPKNELSNVVLLAQYYIAKNFKNRITINELAQYTKVSESTITKQFRKYIGTSPWQYILLKKVNHAIFLLENTKLSCEEIADECGFYDPAHLYKVFKNSFNKSPSDFRLEG